MTKGKVNMDEEYFVKHPVVIIVYNRADKAARLLQCLCQVKPNLLYIIADGPKDDNDFLKCETTRKVFDGIDWQCQVNRIFSDINLGCAKRIPTGLNEVFETEESCIILEDDCIPNLDFFKFCDELLEKYRYDTRIGQISGSNPLGKYDCGNCSYTFSKWGSIWGWATWKRAWRNYDLEIKMWDDERIKSLLAATLRPCVYEIRKEIYDFHCYHTEAVTTWDYQWTFCRSINNQLAVVPNVNLVINIGEGQDSTHTSNVPEVAKKAYKIKNPLSHPNYVIEDVQFDRIIEHRNMGAMTKTERFINKIRVIPHRILHIITRS